MKSMPTPAILEHPFWPVKSDEAITFGTPETPVRHHKVFLSKRGKMIVSYTEDREKRYGVSSGYRILTKGVFQKRFDQIRGCLHNVLKLPDREIEAILGLLRFWAYYGNVYPTAAHVCSEAHCSKSTFWRTIMHLKTLGLIKTVPRFVFRPHAQISNLYRLDKLVILIARYLADRIAHVWDEWLTPILTMPARDFYHWVFQSPEARAGPDALAS